MATRVDRPATLRPLSFGQSAMDASRLKRVMLSLTDSALRVGWLESELDGLGSAVSAALLNTIMEQNEAADPAAHEVLLSITLVLGLHDNKEFFESLRR